MTTLRDVVELSNVSIKQIKEYHKKNILNEVIEIKTRNARTPLSEISQKVGVSESSIRNYQKEFGDTRTRRHMTTIQKQQMILSMQLGKAKSMFQKNKITEDEYNKKVSEINNKYSTPNVNNIVFLIRKIKEVDISMI